MGGEHDRPLDRLQQFSEVLRVALQIPQRVRETNRAVPLVLQLADHCVEAGGVCPRTVDQNDRGLGTVASPLHVPSYEAMVYPQPA
jgi:hypothetical protein